MLFVIKDVEKKRPADARTYARAYYDCDGGYALLAEPKCQRDFISVLELRQKKGAFHSMVFLLQKNAVIPIKSLFHIYWGILKVSSLTVWPDGTALVASASYPFGEKFWGWKARWFQNGE